jgi:hypothetical protein
LSHKSCNFSPCGYEIAVFLAVVVQKLKFLNNSIKEAFPKLQFWESNLEIRSFVEPSVRRLKT